MADIDELTYRKAILGALKEKREQALVKLHGMQGDVVIRQYLDLQRGLDFLEASIQRAEFEAARAEKVNLPIRLVVPVPRGRTKEVAVARVGPFKRPILASRYGALLEFVRDAPDRRAALTDVAQLFLDRSWASTMKSAIVVAGVYLSFAVEKNTLVRYKVGHYEAPSMLTAPIAPTDWAEERKASPLD